MREDQTADHERSSVAALPANAPLSDTCARAAAIMRHPTIHRRLSVKVPIYRTATPGVDKLALQSAHTPSADEPDTLAGGGNGDCRFQAYPSRGRRTSRTDASSCDAGSRGGHSRLPNDYGLDYPPLQGLDVISKAAWFGSAASDRVRCVPCVRRWSGAHSGRMARL
jgi:hypothetical protein